MLTLLEPDLETCLRFRAGELEDRECASHPVLARWRRARRGDPRTVADDELALRRTRAAGVLSRSALLDDVAAELRRRGCALLLADADGVIVSSMGTDVLPEQVARAVSEGTRWSEGARGTNAIGVALVERTAVAVMGRAHFDDGGHGLACYAVPIRGEDGQIIGVLDATAPIDRADPLLGVTVQALGALLEAELTVWRLSNAARPVSLPPRDPENARAALFGSKARVMPLTVTPATTYEDDERREPSPFARLVGDDPALVDARERARRFAPSTLPVLVLAETGTGKELMAHGIHHASDRARGPFVVVNCGAMPESLLASELFGYAPGSFTGARAEGTAGRIGAAQGGTLFLDEIAEMSPALQAMLLRVLEDGSYTRVGEARERRSDFRLISATCRDLPRLVREGAFRQDLFFRLQGVTLHLPSLRARSDRGLLVRELLTELSGERGTPRASWAVPRIDAGALAEIARRPWPGNVRQLKMALHHALVAAREDAGTHGVIEIRAEHLPPDEVRVAHTAPKAPSDEASLASSSSPGSPAGFPAPTSPTSRREAEELALQRALERAGGNMARAARELGVARSTLYRMLRRHGLASRIGE